MAITRAQQFRQMLQKGGPPESVRRGGGQGSIGRPTMAQIAGPASGKSEFVPRSESVQQGTKNPDLLRQQNINQRNVLREARVRAVEDLIDRPTFGFTDAAKFNLTPFPLRFLQGIFGSGTGTVKLPMPGGGGGGGIDTIPYWAQLGFNSEEEYLASLAAKENMKTDKIEEEDDDLRIAFRADGGRIEAQEGGIMPRLNQLGSGVSSAEQMLQGINQRLESAESSLGGSGGNQFSQVTLPETLIQAQQADPNNPLLGVFQSRPENTTGLTAAIPPGTTPNLEELYPNAGQNQINFFRPENSTLRGGIPAAGYADGGNVEGGIMDLESGRQMYFLGKLVKKATRAVKKIVKSPVGKAALFAGLGAYGLGLGPFASGGKFAELAGSGFLRSQGLKDFFIKEGGGLTGGGMLALGGALTAAPLLFQEDDQEDEYQKFLAQRGAGGQLPASIPDIRKNYQDYMARAFVADGGRPEPVAKKTMPLLDMDGQEMDLRAEGGFVPIGRMEKADDVPARLSKNEFVFTADAVRNAGDGDVDKGAEVMYNMMKNLEAGGDVSEESQGIDGARKMFQTSQRLEEVL